MAQDYIPNDGAIYVKHAGYDDPNSSQYRHVTGPTARNYIDLRTKLFKLLKKNIKGVPTIESQNIYKIRNANNTELGEGTTPFDLPAITWSVIRARFEPTRLGQMMPASEEKGKVLVFKKVARYIIQFDCWGNTAEEADIVQQRLHDFFDLNGDELIKQAGANATHLEDLRDMEIRRLMLKFQVRSSQYEIRIGHQTADEVVSDIDTIIVSPGISEAGDFDQKLVVGDSSRIDEPLEVITLLDETD
jgi:hypothetical protein